MCTHVKAYFPLTCDLLMQNVNREIRFTKVKYLLYWSVHYHKTLHIHITWIYNTTYEVHTPVLHYTQKIQMGQFNLHG